MGLSVEGHAGYCPGNDIVCAACSMVAQALYESVRRLKMGVGMSCSSGAFHMCCEDDAQGQARMLFFYAKTAFDMLAAAYPAHVKLIDKGAP